MIYKCTNTYQQHFNEVDGELSGRQLLCGFCKKPLGGNAVWPNMVPKFATMYKAVEAAPQVHQPVPQQFSPVVQPMHPPPSLGITPMVEDKPQSFMPFSNPLFTLPDSKPTQGYWRVQSTIEDLSLGLGFHPVYEGGKENEYLLKLKWTKPETPAKTVLKDEASGLDSLGIDTIAKEIPLSQLPAEGSGYEEAESYRLVLALLQQHRFMFMNRSGNFITFKARSTLQPMLDTVHEPGFRQGQALTHPQYTNARLGQREYGAVYGYGPSTLWGTTFPDFYGKAHADAPAVALELKAPRPNVADYFKKHAVDLIEEITKRKERMPSGCAQVLIVDIYGSGEKLAQAQRDLADFFSSQGGGVKTWSDALDAVLFLHKGSSLFAVSTTSLAGAAFSDAVTPAKLIEEHSTMSKYFKPTQT